MKIRHHRAASKLELQECGSRGFRDAGPEPEQPGPKKKNVLSRRENSNHELLGPGGYFWPSPRVSAISPKFIYGSSPNFQCPRPSIQHNVARGHLTSSDMLAENDVRIASFRQHTLTTACRPLPLLLLPKTRPLHIH